MEKKANNIKYLIAKGVLDMLLKKNYITTQEYIEIDKKNQLSFS